MNFYYSEDRVNNHLVRILFAFATTAVNFLPFYRDRRVVEHLSYADCVLIETPGGAKNLRTLLMHYGMASARIRCIRHIHLAGVVLYCVDEYTTCWRTLREIFRTIPSVVPHRR